MARYRNHPILPETLEKLTELKQLTGLPNVRQLDRIVTEKLAEERRRQANTAAPEAAA